MSACSSHLLLGNDPYDVPPRVDRAWHVGFAVWFIALAIIVSVQSEPVGAVACGIVACVAIYKAWTSHKLIK
jgi:hypothetical protein